MYNPAGVISYTNTSLELHTANDLVLNGSNIISDFAGSPNGQHLRIKLNGNYYKIQLLDD